MKNFKKQLFIVGIFVFTSLHGTAQITAQQILKLQQQRFTAMVNRDTAWLLNAIDDKLVYIHSNGLVQSKKSFIASVASGSIVYQFIEPEEQQVRIYEKAVIVNGVVKVKGIVNGTPFDVRLRYTDIYIKQKKWMMAGWQSLKL